MMLLKDAIQAEVEPVPNRDGWFEITGKQIFLVDFSDALGYIRDAEKKGYAIHRDARIQGMHDEQPECLETDPRFSQVPNNNFAVVQDGQGQFVMVLDINWPESWLFRNLVWRKNWEPREQESHRKQSPV